MDLAQVPLFEALTKRMAWLSDRQTVIAENVANADTPGYVAHDLKPPDFRSILSQTTSHVALATTQPGHIAAARTASETTETKTQGDGTIDGNRVSLEDEMMKVSQTANDFALVSTVYRANLNMIKTVLGRGELTEAEMDLNTPLDVAYSAMNAETTRLKVIAENLANADSTAKTPGGEPYRRQLVTFADVFDKTVGAKRVKVSGVINATDAFGKRYEPGHPAAGPDGYVLTPNVNPITELLDMREAQRSYDANLNVIDAVKAMVSRTIDLLHG